MGVYTHEGDFKFSRIPAKPVLNIPTLVGVEYQHIGLGDGLDVIDFSEGGLFQEKGAYIAGQIGADIRRVTYGIGVGD